MIPSRFLYSNNLLNHIYLFKTFINGIFHLVKYKLFIFWHPSFAALHFLRTSRKGAKAQRKEMKKSFGSSLSY